MSGKFDWFIGQTRTRSGHESHGHEGGRVVAVVAAAAEGAVGAWQQRLLDASTLRGRGHSVPAKRALLLVGASSTDGATIVLSVADSGDAVTVAGGTRHHRRCR